MNEMTKDVVGVLMAIVGVAILAVLVQSANTSSVLKSGGSAFSQMLGTAMGKV